MRFVFKLPYLLNSSFIFETNDCIWPALKEHSRIFESSGRLYLSRLQLNFHFFLLSPNSRRSEWHSRILCIWINIFIFKLIDSAV